MTKGPLTGALRHLRRAALLSDGAGLADGDLLERYLNERDEAAFESLLQRHGEQLFAGFHGAMVVSAIVAALSSVVALTMLGGVKMKKP